MDAKDVGEGPRAKGVDKSDVGLDAEDVSEAPRVDVLAEASCCSLQRYRRRYVVNVDAGDVREAPLAVGVNG